jgi:hypothetical protein
LSRGQLIGAQLVKPLFTLFLYRSLRIIGRLSRVPRQESRLSLCSTRDAERPIATLAIESFARVRRAFALAIRFHVSHLEEGKHA